MKTKRGKIGKQIAAAKIPLLIDGSDCLIVNCCESSFHGFCYTLLVLLMPQHYKSCLSEVEQDLLSVLGDLYGIGDRPYNVESLVVWGDRIVFAFSTDDHRYFLKEWPEYVDFEREAPFILAVQHYAREHGVPAPRVIQTVDGHRIAEWNDRFFTLQEFVGNSYNPAMRSQQNLSCANALGVFHRAVAKCPLKGPVWRNDPFSSSLDFLKQAEERVPDHPLSSMSKRHVLDLIREARDLLEKAKQQAVTLGWLDLPLVPIHGDYCQFNCRFERNQVVGIVDWDHSRLSSRVLDVAHALNIGLGWQGSIDYYEDFLWRESVIPHSRELGDWFRAYCQSAPSFCEEELQLIPMICAASWPMPSGGFEPKCKSEVPGCDAFVKYMRHFINGSESISEDLKALLRM